MFYFPCRYERTSRTSGTSWSTRSSRTTRIRRTERTPATRRTPNAAHERAPTDENASSYAPSTSTLTVPRSRWYVTAPPPGPPSSPSFQLDCHTPHVYNSVYIGWPFIALNSCINSAFSLIITWKSEHLVNVSVEYSRLNKQLGASHLKICIYNYDSKSSSLFCKSNM